MGILPLAAACLLACGASAAFETPALYPIASGRKWGYMDRSGALKIPARYDRAFDFHEGRASVREGDAWGLIDETGAWVVRPKYGWIGPFSGGFAVAEGQAGSGWTLIDRSGETKAGLDFSWASHSISHGLVRVSTRNLTGYADMSGSLAIPAAFKEALDFTPAGLARVKGADSLWGYIDTKGSFVIKPRYVAAAAFDEGLAAVKPDSWSQWIFVDREGKQAFPGTFELTGKFSEGLAAVETAKLWGYVDKSGRWIIKPSFDAAREFSEGLAEVRVDGKWGYVDRSGRLAVEPRFLGDGSAPFRGGLALVLYGARHGYVDAAGRFVWDPMKGFGAEVALLLLGLIAASCGPGIAAHWLGHRAWRRMRGAAQEAKLELLHSLQNRLTALSLVHMAVFIGGGAGLAWLMQDTLEHAALLLMTLTGGLGRAGRPLMVVAVVAFTLVPYFGGLILVSTGGFKADRLARGTRWTMGEAASSALRGLVIMTFPTVLWVVAAGYLPDNPYVIWPAVAAFLLTLFTFSPLWIRLLWKARPLPEGEVARTISELSRRAGIRFSGVLVWQVARARIANAMVSGILPFCRYVFLTDFLLERFTPAEIAAVIGHEIGHIKKRHLWYYLGFTAAYSVLTVLLFWIGGRFAFIREAPPLALHGGILAWYMLYFVLLFGKLSRRFELEADRYAGELTGDPGAMASALEKLAELNGAQRRPARWIELMSPHPSFEKRVAAIKGRGAAPAP